MAGERYTTRLRLRGRGFWLFALQPYALAHNALSTQLLACSHQILAQLRCMQYSRVGLA